jgi:hypothetical protein
MSRSGPESGRLVLRDVFYFEFDTAKVFPFRPSCSSYDSERKKSQKVSQKGPEKKVNKCGKLGITALGGL